MAIGTDSEANFTNSAAFGTGATATRENQMVLGTASNTYSAPGIASDASRAAQSGPLEVVTSDGAGNLATDGGSIFATLEQGAPAYADRFATLFGTPHGVDVASLCAAARVPHLRVTSLPELEQALASPNGGIEVVEARVRRDNRRALDEKIRALAP